MEFQNNKSDNKMTGTVTSDLNERIYYLYCDLYDKELLSYNKVQLVKNNIMLQYMSSNNKIDKEILDIEDIKPVQKQFIMKTFLDYNEYYLKINTSLTQIIDPEIKETFLKHGLDFGEMIIFDQPPEINPDLEHSLIIKIKDIKGENNNK